MSDFTYKVSDKATENGRVRVTIDYTNGTVNASETTFITSLDDLDNKIEAKLKELEANVLLETSIVVNEYVMAVKEETVPVPVDPIQEAEQAVNIAWDRLQKGKIEQPEYDVLLATYKTLVSGSEK